MGAIHVHLMLHVQMKLAAIHVTARMASEAMTHLVKVGKSWADYLQLFYMLIKWDAQRKINNHFRCE